MKPANDVSRAVTHRDLKPLNYKPFGHQDYSADVVAGESIRIYGTDQGKAFDRTFRVGDIARHGGINIDFTDPITAIGAKTVSFKGKRFNLYEFAWRNRDFSVESSRKKFLEWAD